MKNILQQQIDNRRSGGYSFLNSNPEVTVSRSGAFSGVSGAHMMNLTVDVSKLNTEIRSWGDQTASILKQNVASKFTRGKNKTRTYKTGLHQGLTERKLSGTIRAKYRKERGGEQIETIGFNLARHGVFLQKGVGRGYVAQGGGVARIAKSDTAKDFPNKHDWFNGTLSKRAPLLANIIMQHAGNAIVLNTKKMFIS